MKDAVDILNQRIAELESDLLLEQHRKVDLARENERLRKFVEKRGLIDVFNDLEKLTAENERLREDSEKYRCFKINGWEVMVMKDDDEAMK